MRGCAGTEGCVAIAVTHVESDGFEARVCTLNVKSRVYKFLKFPHGTSRQPSALSLDFPWGVYYFLFLFTAAVTACAVSATSTAADTRAPEPLSSQ